ncbi:hypothetical protein JTE90_027719 [Oedothorax gibbosus]|uniref:Uncharacterized protein n=1 Tax=Oedothorax gibbosus TaxID=931172 RepID=A0AAV6UVY3_9ARAC|nr:hypothetical protein JTE90_027719 [Oedothorax gibbosus]
MSPVVELKEEAENQVLKADVCGHLQLVDVSEGAQVPCNATERNESGKPRKLNRDYILLKEAEKKKILRMKMKTENPAMWCALKEKEAMRKRELREQRKKIMHEMQGAMEATSLLYPDSSEYLDQQMYLDALKERYPEIWNQLINAIPEMEKVNNDKMTKTRRNNVPKPPKMYQNVIEAQKKRLYRKRMKEERPEMYLRQKAREAFAYQRQKAKWAFEKSLQTFVMESVESNADGVDQQQAKDLARQFSDEGKLDDHPLNNPSITNAEYYLVQSEDTYACGILPIEVIPSSSATISTLSHTPVVVTDASIPCKIPIVVSDTSSNNMVVDDASIPCKNPVEVSNTSTPFQNHVEVSATTTSSQNPIEVTDNAKNAACPNYDNEYVYKDLTTNKNPVHLSPAEQKKQNKTENPALWSAIKEKEAIRKLRERQKKIMQESASEVSSLSMPSSEDEKTSEVILNDPPIKESESMPIQCKDDQAYECGVSQKESSQSSSSNSFTPAPSTMVVSGDLKNEALPNCDSEYLSNTFTVNGDPVHLTQTGQKKMFRMKMKREIPALWRAMKEKDALHKRESREERKKTMQEMQHPLQATSLLSSTLELSNERMYPEALKERQLSNEAKVSNGPPYNLPIINSEYMPQLSLADHSDVLQKEIASPSSTISSTLSQNPVEVSDTSTTCYSPGVVGDTSNHCRNPIVVRIRENSKIEVFPNCDNKDVDSSTKGDPVHLTQAEQKKLYRMKIKKENPELWSQIKAKDALRKRELREQRRKTMQEMQPSLQVMSLNCFPPSVQRPNLGEEKIPHFQFNNPPTLNSEHIPMHSEGDPSYACSVSLKEIASPSSSATPSHTPNVASDCSENKTFPTCDQEHVKADYPIETITNMLPNIYSDSPPTTKLSSTQSDMLWYWNDVKTEPVSDDIYFDDPEERKLRKIVRQRTSLLEKRRQDRLKLSPEERAKVLEAARERVKNYRLKKQGEGKKKKRGRKKMDEDDKAWCPNFVLLDPKNT